MSDETRPGTEHDDFRVLVYAPVDRDAAQAAAVLARASVSCHRCGSVSEVCDCMEAGAAAVLMTEEALADQDINRLTATLDGQPPWSDISVLVFAGADRAQVSTRTLRQLELLRNATLLDRPIRVSVAISAVRAALRSRMRQYEMRNVLMALRTAKNEAQNANRLKDEFLATLSHELRTPLNAIMGWISMLRRSQIEPDRIPKVLQVIERNAQTQAELIGDVLDVSRMLSGRLKLRLAPAVVPAIVREAVESLKPAAAAKSIDVQVIESPQTGMIQGDAERLRQIYWNLLSNAIKFTPAGGWVHVSIEGDESSAEVVVSDSGVGLDPEFLPFVFERCRQADQSFTRAYGGLGLGLAIVKYLVELHGGQVTAESPGVGRGATFRVRLPKVMRLSSALDHSQADSA